MNKYFTVIFTLFVIQRSDCGSVKFMNPESLQIEVNLNIASLLSDAQKLTSDAGAAIRQITQQADTYGRQRLQDAENVFNTLRQAAESDLRNAVANAGGPGENLIKCIDARQTELGQFWSGALNNITGCVTEKIDRAISIVTNIVNASLTIGNITFNLPEKINSTCPLASEAIPDRVGQMICSLGEIVKASTAVVAQGSIISQNIMEATTLINSLSSIQVEMPTCFVSRFTKSATQFAIEYVAPIIGCTLQQQ